MESGGEQRTEAAHAGADGRGEGGFAEFASDSGAALNDPSAVSASALTLPVLVTKILAGSPEPISGRVLAEKVLASGYQTKSKDFMNVLWVGVGKMDNVENVPG